MRRFIGIVGTIAIHLWLLMALINFSSKFDAVNQQEQASSIDTQIRLAVTLYDLEEMKAERKIPDSNYPQTAITIKEDCPEGAEVYLGIGVLFNGTTGIITSVPPNLPAYKAGIRTGDILLERTRDVTGPTTVVSILRNGVELQIVSDVQEICYEDGR